MTKTKLRSLIREFKKGNDYRLFKRVCNYYLSTLNDEDSDYTLSHMSDVVNYGCISGTVGELIYYVDTLRFFDLYKNEIRELYDSIGYDESFNFKYWEARADEDLTTFKNEMAWFGFEEVSAQLQDHIECYK